MTPPSRVPGYRQLQCLPIDLSRELPPGALAHRQRKILVGGHISSTIICGWTAHQAQHDNLPCSYREPVRNRTLTGNVPGEAWAYCINIGDLVRGVIEEERHNPIRCES
jgi:hypothetical protein